jgi:hypothetical protein
MRHGNPARDRHPAAPVLVHPGYPFQRRELQFVRPGADREAAVSVGEHVFVATTLEQAPADEGAQNAPAQGGPRGLDLTEVVVRMPVNVTAGLWIQASTRFRRS